MTWLSKLGSWTKKNLGTIAQVALPVVGFAAGLVAPGVGATIGRLADKFGNKVASITGVGDSKPGILGIGDGLPGVLGIGTGKGKLKKTVDIAKLVLAALKEKEDSGVPLTSEEKTAKTEAQADMKKEGLNPLFLLGGAALAFFALGGNSRR